MGKEAYCRFREKQFKMWHSTILISPDLVAERMKALENHLKETPYGQNGHQHDNNNSKSDGLTSGLTVLETDLKNCCCFPNKRLLFFFGNWLTNCCWLFNWHSLLFCIP